MMARGIAMIVALGCSALVASALDTWSWQKPSREDYTSGAYLYRAFCASCHGATGAGDGPAADIGPRASDLTLLSRKNGGVFPRAEVLSVMQQVKKVPGHQVPAMPNWLDVLRKTERGDEHIVRMRLDALVSHVETLQKNDRDR